MRIFIEFFKIEMKTFWRDPIAIFWTFLFPFIILFTVMSTSGKGGTDDHPEIIVAAADLDSTLLAKKTGKAFEKLNDVEVSASNLSLSQLLTDFNENNLVIYASPCPATTEKCTRIEVYHAKALNDLMQLMLNQLQYQQSALVSSHQVQWQYIAVEAAKNEQTRLENKARQLTIGLICMNIASICLFGFSVILVQLRENDGLKFFQVMPVRKSVFISAFTLSRVFIINIFAIFFILVSNFSFGLNIDFSMEYFLKFIFMISIGSATFVCFGILVASRFTSASSANGLINLLYFPLIFTSGIFFPVTVENKILSFISEYSPLKVYSEMFYAVYFNSERLVDYSGSIFTLSAWCLLSGLIAFKIFIWVKND
jgi:ABC-type multidrug transport system permease subunit